MVVVKVVELSARGRAARGRPAGGVGDKQFCRLFFTSDVAFLGILPTQ